MEHSHRPPAAARWKPPALPWRPRWVTHLLAPTSPAVQSLSRLLSCTSDPPTACRREHNCSNPPAGTASTSSPHGTTHPSPLAALRLQTLMLPVKGPPIKEGNLPWLWKQLQNVKINESSKSFPWPRGVNLTHLPCRALGQAAGTTGGARESSQIPEGHTEHAASSHS